MSVWFAIPSVRPPAEANACLRKWRGMGYKIALLRQGEPTAADLTIPTKKYLGWAPSVNLLARWVLAGDPTAEWIVTGGDDYEPDPAHRAEDIARECTAQFGGTFGVMQPTGDRWGDAQGAYLDRIAGSPWLGRDWCLRAYGGRGPLWGEYYHMYGDEELQAAAIQLGAFWQRRDLVQTHLHWSRTVEAKREGAPAFLKFVNSPAHWQKAKALFQSRRAAGFPGLEPL